MLSLAEPFLGPAYSAILKAISGAFLSPVQRVSAGKAGADAASEAGPRQAAIS